MRTYYVNQSCKEEAMKVMCESCKGTWSAADKLGVDRNCPHCGKHGKIMSICSKCGKRMIADTSLDKNAKNVMVNKFAGNIAIRCPKCKFLGHWDDFALVLNSSRSFLGIRY